MWAGGSSDIISSSPPPWPTSHSSSPDGTCNGAQSGSHHPAQEAPHPGRREERPGLDSEAHLEWS